jgi:hypothetical protein
MRGRSWTDAAQACGLPPIRRTSTPHLPRMFGIAPIRHASLRE